MGTVPCVFSREEEESRTGHASLSGVFEEIEGRDWGIFKARDADEHIEIVARRLWWLEEGE